MRDIVVYEFNDELDRRFAERLLYDLTADLWYSKEAVLFTAETQLTHEFVAWVENAAKQDRPLRRPRSVPYVASKLALALGYWVEDREGHNLVPFYPEDTPEQAARRRLMYDEQLELIKQHRDLHSKYDIPERK